MSDYQTGLVDGFSDGCIMDQFPNLDPFTSIYWNETNFNAVKVEDFSPYILGYKIGVELSSIYLGVDNE